MLSANRLRRFMVAGRSRQFGLDDAAERLLSRAVNFNYVLMDLLDDAIGQIGGYVTWFGSAVSK